MSVNLRALAALLFVSLMLPPALAGGNSLNSAAGSNSSILYRDYHPSLDGVPHCPVENAVMCSEKVALVPRNGAIGPSIWVHTKERVTETKLSEIKKLEGVAFATAHNDYLVSIERAPMVPEKELVEKLSELFK